MYQITLLSYILLLNGNCVKASGIYHENTKITFNPGDLPGYFGYSVLLNPFGLIVGAPKAASSGNSSISPGVVFNCSLHNLDTVKNVTCHPMGSEDPDFLKNRYRTIISSDFFKDDMWFGATLAAISDGKTMICAPRWALPYREKHLLANGVCYLHTKDRDWVLYPLRDARRQSFMADGKRKEYGEYTTHLNFYAYGQAGMSIKVTTNNTVIIGAPGLLQWTGGIVNFKFNPAEDSIMFSKQPTTNPYYTKELGPDDYFGYSVESGIFEENGQVLYVGGAPRSKMGYGQVIIFEAALREMDPLNIQGKIIGPQLGAYFGASLCCTDIDGDGRSDLLVGAPTFVKKDGGLPYDQGAVFVYMSREKNGSFVLEEFSYVSGSGESGARFGTTIADLGDVDGDGYKDVAIGAPWENEGRGVVYIYRGSANGLHSQYAQKIEAEGSQSFGISIAKGFDVDHNNCSDLVIGAHNSESAYLYRCVPTMQVQASIKVPDAMNLPYNATGFTALFCVTVPAKPLWPHVKIDLKARITIDPEENRAMISGDAEYRITAKPGIDMCEEQTVEVKPTADLSRPISIKFELEPVELLQNDSSTFLMDAARLSEESGLHSSFLIQLIRDCGNDMICTPWLAMSLEALDNPYIPGSETRLGVTVIVSNKKEPAYGARVNITLPYTPIRVPSDCSLRDLNMTCDVPAPLFRDEEVIWEIELEYTSKETRAVNLNIVAELEDPLYNRNISDDTIKELEIEVTPQFNVSVSGKALPNATLSVTREKLYNSENITFIHYFEITNFGPSDWYDMTAEVLLPEKINLSAPVKGCEVDEYNIKCTWTILARIPLPVFLQLRFDLAKHGEFLIENEKFNVTTGIVLSPNGRYISSEITTTLELDPATPIWPVIVGVVAGLLVLAVIVYVLYKFGFFSREKREKWKKLKEDKALEEEKQSKEPVDTMEPVDIANESTVELLGDDD